MPMIDHYVHRSGEWVLSSVDGLEGTLYIASIDCSLRLADVYDRISFPKERPGDDSESGISVLEPTA
ncbi:MAG TPA: hypothetical protein VN937_15695 [Blastocatellia bacterium]|nr:hypothetical protein [Blastocatellia bacterium]